MAKLLKLRRGTTSQHSSFTGAEGEVTVDMDKDVLVVHDGSTAGGHPVAAEDLANVSSSTIAGRLSNDAIAVGKIAAGTLPSDVKVADANVTGNLTIESADIVDGTIATGDIGDDQVTYAKIQNVSATNRILGRDSSGAGVIEEITPANLRTMINVADGATNVTNTNQLTNGAGFITSADGGNADTVDSLHAASFLRADAADSGSGLLSLSGGVAFSDAAKCTAAVSDLTDGSNITVDLTSGIHHTVTLGGNRTFVNSGMNTGSAVGQSGSIFIIQDGTGGRLGSFQSTYKFAGGTAPTLSTAANAVDRLDYVVRSADNVHCVVTLDVK